MSVIVAFVAEYLPFGIVALEVLYAFIASRSRLRELITAALCIGLVALALALVAHRFIEDPRPFVASGARPLIHSSTDNGFPSDHTLLLGISAAVILVVNRRMGLLALLAAFVVGVARVYAGVHHIQERPGKSCNRHDRIWSVRGVSMGAEQPETPDGGVRILTPRRETFIGRFPRRSKVTSKIAVTVVLLCGVALPAAYAQSADLFALAKTGTPQSIRAAIDAGAQVNARDKDGRSVLMWAALQNQSPEVIATLLKAALTSRRATPTTGRR